VPQDLQALLALRDLLAPQVVQALRVTPALLDLRVPQVVQALLDLLDLRVPQVVQALRVTQVLLDLRVPQVVQALLDIQDLLVQLDTQDLLALLDTQDLLVRLDQLDQLALLVVVAILEEIHCYIYIILTQPKINPSQENLQVIYNQHFLFQVTQHQ
jgi:hypothetical protein